MQIDFHHAVVYILARLAGFDHSECSTVAYASQYVDDATNRGTIVFDNGRRYAHIASAHEVLDLYDNCNVKEDCDVWVPFHFLPGNNGAAAGEALELPIIQRLLCTPDSPVAADMRDGCLQARGQQNSLHRLGITTHTYADTWAHQRFAGLRHSINSASDVQLEQKYNTKEFLDILAAALMSSLVKVGHAALQTYPDMPFLRFTYKDSFGKVVNRDNPAEFMVACRRIFNLFESYRGVPATQLLPKDEQLLQDSLRGFDDADCHARHGKWLDRLEEDNFSFGRLSQDELKQLDYKPKGAGSWKYEALGTERSEDSPDERFHYDPAFEQSNWKLFHDALKTQHCFLLDEILPKYQLPLTPELVRAAGA